jgi:hypothetical protein
MRWRITDYGDPPAFAFLFRHAMLHMSRIARIVAPGLP